MPESTYLNPTYSALIPFDNAVENLKILPHSSEAEQSVLGGLMLDNQKWFDVADLLIETDFYYRTNQLIFRAIKELSEKGQPSDYTTLLNWLTTHALLEQASGTIYLIDIVRNTPSAANILAYANIVRERSILRQLIRACNQIIENTYNTKGQNADELLNSAERQIFEIAEQGANRKGGFTKVSDTLPAVLDRIDFLYQHGGEVTGIATGFTDFDKMTAGLQRSDLIIVAGRPAMGKTTFAMNIAEHVAINNKLPVAVFSMEMSAEQLVMRILSSLSRVNLQNIRTGKLVEEDWNRFTTAISLLSEAPLFIDESGGLNPTELQARARRLMREQGELGLIVVDYVQLMQVPDIKENRTVEVSAISRALKLLAKDLNVPVIALSQLNRGLEQRPDKRPRMADLRESGSLEQDADIIVFIYRDEVYHEDSQDKGTAEIIIGKQRNGPTGKVKLTFLGNITKFENYSDSYYYGES